MDEGTGILPGLPAGRGQAGACRFRRRPADFGRRDIAAGGGRAAARDRRAAGRLHRGPARRRNGCGTTLAEMIRYRALLIAAGYPDGNDCDALRSRSGLQDGGRAAARERRRSVLAADHQPAGEPARPDRAQAHDGGDGRVVLRQLRAGAAAHPARHRRHRGPGSRRPATGAVQRLLRQPLLPADPHLRGDAPASRWRSSCAPARRRTAPRWRWCCAMSSAISAPAGRQSTSWCAATAITAGPRRWRGASATASATSSAWPATRCCCAGSADLAEDAALGPPRRRGRQGPPLRRLPLRRDKLEGRAPRHRPRRGRSPRCRQPLHRHQSAGPAEGALREGLLRAADRPKT